MLGLLLQNLCSYILWFDCTPNLLQPSCHAFLQDFTFVCPTEIIAFSDRAEEFKDLNCDLIAASTDTEEVSYAEHDVAIA